MEYVEKVLRKDQRLKSLLDLCVREVPKVRFVRKDSSWLMKFFGFVARLYTRDFDHMIVALGTNVYLPDAYLMPEVPTSVKLAGIAHETIHLIDQRDLGRIKFLLMYSFPQNLSVLALLALGAFWNIWFLGAVGFLVALFPWGSWYRSAFELKAYTATLACHYWQSGTFPDFYKKAIAEALSGGPYYWACSSKRAEVELEKIKDGIIADSLPALKTPFMQEVKKICKGVV